MEPTAARGRSSTTSSTTSTSTGILPSPNPRHSICMVCDFFYPRLGGVEMHIWSLAQCLLKMGHKVIVFSNLYTTNAGKRVGIRTMANGLKVYYIPAVPMADQATLPTYGGQFPTFRKILLRERITIVHGHAATAPLEHECILQARTMGYKTIYTDHSLFGFADAASINVNKFLKFTLTDVDHAICVSHTCRENLVLRAALDPRRVSTIPNAVDASKFTPNPSARPPASSGIINIVMVSRLVYRKGIDLVVNVIPTICARFPQVRFIIGGDGPKKLLLEEMRERHQLHDRVELLGAVPHRQVRDVLTRGHIFLNASLTESFCIAILEAACCGCFVVSTRVGGVPEVLPQRMIRFAEPSPDHLIDALEHAIPICTYSDPHSFHAELKEMYNWPEVAARTVRVYDSVSATPPMPLIERYRRLFGIGRFFGPLACIMVTILYFFWGLLEILTPAIDIDIAPDLPWEELDVLETPESVKAAHVALNTTAAISTSTSAAVSAANAANAAVSATNSAGSGGSEVIQSLGANKSRTTAASVATDSFDGSGMKGGGEGAGASLSSPSKSNSTTTTPPRGGKNKGKGSSSSSTLASSFPSISSTSQGRNGGDDGATTITTASNNNNNRTIEYTGYISTEATAKTPSSPPFASPAFLHYQSSQQDVDRSRSDSANSLTPAHMGPATTSGEGKNGLLAAAAAVTTHEMKTKNINSDSFPRYIGVTGTNSGTGSVSSRSTNASDDDNDDDERRGSRSTEQESVSGGEETKEENTKNSNNTITSARSTNSRSSTSNSIRENNNNNIVYSNLRLRVPAHLVGGGGQAGVMVGEGGTILATPTASASEMYLSTFRYEYEEAAATEEAGLEEVRGQSNAIVTMGNETAAAAEEEKEKDNRRRKRGTGTGTDTGGSERSER